jgi:transcriptional regulator with XRE-family HTH domain
MSINVDEATQRLARRIRLERESRGWSLEVLASHSGVARSTISKIERGEASPTAVVLVRLATAFDLTLGGLLARAEGDAERLVHAADQPVWRDPSTGYLRRQVFERADHPLELARIELPVGALVGLPACSYHGIRQVIWVLSGELVIEEGGARHELAAGDSLCFGPPTDVTFTNRSDAPCTYLVAVARV